MICGLGPPIKNPGYACGGSIGSQSRGTGVTNRRAGGKCPADVGFLQSVFRGEPLYHGPLFGSPIMYEYLRIVRKIKPCPPFGILAENLRRKTDWIWVKTFLWSSSFSSGFYLSFQISGYAPGPPFENPAYAIGPLLKNALLFRNNDFLEERLHQVRQSDEKNYRVLLKTYFGKRSSPNFSCKKLRIFGKDLFLVFT